MDFPDTNAAGSGPNKGRGAKEMVPRIDFQERAETHDTPGKGRGVEGGKCIELAFLSQFAWTKHFSRLTPRNLMFQDGSPKWKFQG